MKSIFVAAIIAAGCSGVALAGDVKQEQKTAPAVQAAQMSDSEMDKVTAGGAFFTPNPQLGAFDTAIEAGHSQVNNAFDALDRASLLANRPVGNGTCNGQVRC